VKCQRQATRRREHDDDDDDQERDGAAGIGVAFGGDVVDR